MKRNEIKTKNLSRMEWLQLRRNGIGGSDASVVMGENPWRSILQLWEEKTGRLEIADNGNEFTYWGNVMEPIIRKEFMKRTGLKVRQKHALIFHPEFPYLCANLDGIVTDENGEKCVFEAKTVSQYKADQWDGKIPREYMWQVQHYLFVCDMKKAYVAALVGGNQFIFHVVYRDEEMIRELVQEEQRFWNDCVQADIQPKADGSEATLEYLNEKYKNPIGDRIKLDASVTTVLEEYDKVDGELKGLEKRKNEITNYLKSVLKEHESGEVAGRVVSWKKVEKFTVDNKRLREEKPELYSQYQKDSSYRRLSVA